MAGYPCHVLRIGEWFFDQTFLSTKSVSYTIRHNGIQECRLFNFLKTSEIESKIRGLTQAG